MVGFWIVDGDGSSVVASWFLLDGALEPALYPGGAKSGVPGLRVTDGTPA